MAIVFADKVKVRSHSSGTAEFILETVVPGFQSFAAIGAGNECYYGIEDAAGNWEVGRGTYDTDSSQEILTRDSVISSSNSNNLVNFPRGGKTVFVTIPSSVAASIVASSASDSFKTISVSGQSNVVADSATDTLTLVSGDSISITTDAGSDTITVATDLSAVSQNIIPSVDSDGTTGYTLGSASFKWKELFVSNGSIYIGDIKLSNVGGKLTAVKVINPGEETEEEDPEDSDATSEIGGGAAVVERGVVFPEGEDGDVAGVLANDEGILYLSTADWFDYSTYVGEYSGLVTTGEFSPGQTGLVSNVATILRVDVPPELLYILTNVAFVPSDWEVAMDDEGFGGTYTCTDVTFDVDNNPVFLWPYRDGVDPFGIPEGSGFTVTYNGTIPQPGIWKRFIAADDAGTQILSNGRSINLTVEESAADDGGGSIQLEYIPHPDSTDSVNSTLTVNDTNINLDVGNNDLWLESDGLSFDNGYALMQPTSVIVEGNSTDVVYTTKNIRGFTRVVKLLIKVECNDNFQACEMLVVVGDTVEGVDTRIRHTVYAVVHTSDNPLATFSAQWNNTDGTIEITATNVDTVNNMFVETMTIEMTSLD